MTVEPNGLTMRPITGREEIGLFNQLPYVLNEELADDLAHGRWRQRPPPHVLRLPRRARRG